MHATSHPSRPQPLLPAWRLGLRLLAATVLLGTSAGCRWPVTTPRASAPAPRPVEDGGEAATPEAVAGNARSRVRVTDSLVNDAAAASVRRMIREASANESAAQLLLDGRVKLPPGWVTKISYVLAAEPGSNGAIETTLSADARLRLQVGAGEGGRGMRIEGDVMDDPAQPAALTPIQPATLLPGRPLVLVVGLGSATVPLHVLAFEVAGEGR